MIRAPRRMMVGVAAVLVAAAVGGGIARGRGGGGGARGGARGGFNRTGAAAGGSFGQGRPARGVERGGFSNRRPAAVGDFAGQQPSGGFGGGGNVGGGQQIDRSEVAQRQRERFGRLGPPDGGAPQRQDRQDNATHRREDWQDYADDHWDEHHDDHPGVAAGVVAGAAVGAAVAAATTPAYWTLSCVPTTVVVGGTTYYQCGSAWYVRVYSGGDVAYFMTNPPAGY